MRAKTVVLGAAAYTLVTFPLAVIWHVGLFESTYQVLGYFSGQPSFLLGLLAIITQGVLLSYAYGKLKFKGGDIVRGLKFSMLAGGFYWTCHVLAHAAKNPSSRVFLFFALETFYLVMQFGIYGILIGWIAKKRVQFLQKPDKDIS